MPSYRHHVAHDEASAQEVKQEAKLEEKPGDSHSHEVASIIKEQLGVMTFALLGARSFLHGYDEEQRPFIHFSIQGSPVANRVRIALDPNDTYSVSSLQVSRVGGELCHNVIAKSEGVYVDSLHETIKDHVKLETKF